MLKAETGNGLANNSPLVSGEMRGQFPAIQNNFDDVRAHLIALTPPSRLVGEERPERRDHRNKSGLNDVLDHVLNVLVSGGSLLIEQVSLSADDPAAQRALTPALR